MAEIGRFDKLAYTLWPANKVRGREEIRPEQQQQQHQQQQQDDRAQQHKDDDEPGQTIDEYV